VLPRVRSILVSVRHLHGFGCFADFDFKRNTIEVKEGIVNISKTPERTLYIVLSLLNAAFVVETGEELMWKLSILPECQCPEWL